MSIDQDQIDDFMYRTYGYTKPIAKATGSYERAGDADGRIRPPGGAPKAPGAEYERAGDADGRIRPPGGAGGPSAMPKKRTPSTTPYSDKVKPTPSSSENDLVDSEFAPTRRMERASDDKPTSSSQPKPGVAYMDPEGKQEAPHFTSSRSEVPPWQDGATLSARDDDKGLNMDVGPMLGGRRPVYPSGSWQERDMADEFRQTGVIRPASAHDRSMAAVRHMATPQPHYETGEPITPKVSIRQMREAYKDPSNQRVMDSDDPRYDGSTNGYQSKAKSMGVDQDQIDDFMYRTYGYEKPPAKSPVKYENALEKARASQMEKTWDKNQFSGGDDDGDVGGDRPFRVMPRGTRDQAADLRDAKSSGNRRYEGGSRQPNNAQMVQRHERAERRRAKYDSDED